MGDGRVESRLPQIAVIGRRVRQLSFVRRSTGLDLQRAYAAGSIRRNADFVSSHADCTRRLRPLPLPCQAKRLGLDTMAFVIVPLLPHILISAAAIVRLTGACVWATKLGPLPTAGSSQKIIPARRERLLVSRIGPGGAPQPQPNPSPFGVNDPGLSPEAGVFFCLCWAPARFPLLLRTIPRILADRSIPCRRSAVPTPRKSGGIRVPSHFTPYRPGPDIFQPIYGTKSRVSRPRVALHQDGLGCRVPRIIRPPRSKGPGGVPRGISCLERDLRKPTG
jgi:hypothetical protein